MMLRILAATAAVPLLAGCSPSHEERGRVPSIDGTSIRGVRLGSGIYRATMTISGTSTQVEGDGPGRTAIDGDLDINGSNHLISGVTVLGRTFIKGSGNRLSQVELRGGVQDGGAENRY
jgi:hypothetical protein